MYQLLINLSCYWSLLLVSLLAAYGGFDQLQHQQQPALPPPPDKLAQGCSPELLHLRTYRHFYQLCRQQPALAVSAYEGIRESMEQCREKMRFQPWDCSQPGTILHEPGVLKYGYRESAYLWAMSAAGAAWGVATACAQGWLDECKCVGDDGGAGARGWEWGGCSYGVQYGITTARKILTRQGLAKSPLKNLEKHNLKAGRIAVKKTLISSCKCHGVSGSCQQRTCWKKTAHLSEISNHLTEKYRKAKRIADGNAKTKNADLVFLENSPDICSYQHKHLMHRRTLPRICNWRNETHSQGNCNKLCCGKGFHVSHEVTSYKCDCKFIWCCKLECNDCLQHQWVSTCAP